jgi:SAM-dependent methyltransferase
MHNQLVREREPLWNPFVAALFHIICSNPKPAPADQPERYFAWRLAQARTFLERFGARVDVRGKRILDLGCGYGAMSILLAQHGAERVVGVDTDELRVAYANQKLKASFAGIAHKVTFAAPAALTEERFNVVVSQDCFEHYEDPKSIMRTIRGILLDNGQVVIGFSPLWKSPYGGHIGYMTKLPWAHLLFPESVIMQERKRYRPDEDSHAFAAMKGGLNKMTYARFLATMHDSGYKIDFLATNVTDSKLRPAVNLLRRLPFCFEYFTKNLYAIVRPDTILRTGF